MPQINVQTEEEIPHGWIYRVMVRAEGGATTEHRVRLDWVDHDHWSGGKCPPSKVVEALVEVLAARSGNPLPAKFDAATARRWYPGLDEQVRGRL